MTHKLYSRLRGALKKQRQQVIDSAPATTFQVAILGLCWVFRDFLDLGLSVAFIGSLFLVACAFVFFGCRRYLAATAAFFLLLGFVAVMSATASYFISSDQLRLRYRVADGISYVEFPAQISFLGSVLRFLVATS
jgi:hypothetical protein